MLESLHMATFPNMTYNIKNGPKYNKASYNDITKVDSPYWVF